MWPPLASSLPGSSTVTTRNELGTSSRADVVWHGGALGTVSGVDIVVPILGGFIGALTDIDAAEQDVIASGDLVALRLVVSATHTGRPARRSGDRPPIQWDAVDIYRVTDDGRISEQWAFEDLAAILSQAGAISLPWGELTSQRHARGREAR